MSNKDMSKSTVVSEVDKLDNIVFKKVIKPDLFLTLSVRSPVNDLMSTINVDVFSEDIGRSVLDDLDSRSALQYFDDLVYRELGNKYNVIGIKKRER